MRHLKSPRLLDPVRPARVLGRLLTCFRALLLCAIPVAMQAQSQPPALQLGALHDVKLESGQRIHDCTLGYRVFGTMNRQQSNVILLPMWFTGRSGDASGLIGPGRLIDDRKYFIVAIDPLGNGVSCSPSNSTAQHGMRFPQFSIRDMVETEHRLATEVLHLKHVHAVIGVSMGGMQTFQWVVSYPNFMDAAVPVVGSPQLTSYDLLLWQSEALALRSDPAWQGGDYTQQPELPLVSLLHNMHLTTPQFRVDHTTRDQFPEFFRSTEHARSFDANDYLFQLNAMIGQDIARGTDLLTIVKRIKVPMLIINAAQDHMVNPVPALALARLLHAQTLVLDSDCGHSAPGCEAKRIGPVIDRFLSNPGADPDPGAALGTGSR